MLELKPCPFCGKDTALAVLEKPKFWTNRIGIETQQYQVVCDKRKGGCDASTGFYESTSEARECWNRRTENGR